MAYNFAILDFSTPELLIILLIVLLLFGGKKLPELSKSLGKSVRELRSGLSDDNNAKNQQNQDKSRQQSTD